MKLTKITALVLAVVMFALVLASCGNVFSEVHVKFIDGDGNTIGDTTVKVKGTKADPPTVLDAACAALDFLDFENGYEVTADGNSIKAVNGIAEIEETDAENGYYSYWRVTINGVDSSSGRQSVTPVGSGSEVVFTYVHDSKPRQDVSAETTVAE